MLTVVTLESTWTFEWDLLCHFDHESLRVYSCLIVVAILLHRIIVSWSIRWCSSDKLWILSVVFSFSPVRSQLFCIILSLGVATPICNSRCGKLIRVSSLLYIYIRNGAFNVARINEKCQLNLNTPISFSGLSEADRWMYNSLIGCIRV